MDHRRAPRPPAPAGPRRHIFHAPSRRPNPHLSTQLSTSSLHISAEESDPKDDMVERDSSGDYCMAAPNASLNKREVDGVREGDNACEEEENQLIALYGKHNQHYDQNSEALLVQIKEVLDSSLEKKVQSLEHDLWVFEGESKSKG